MRRISTKGTEAAAWLRRVAGWRGALDDEAPARAGEDGATLETIPMTSSADELARLRAALADTQAALAAALADAAAAREQQAQGRRQRHAFLAGLAHDLRNPLAPLSNGLELLRLADADPAGRLRTRGILERQVASLMRMAEALSELARLSGDRPSLQAGTCTLGELLRATRDDAQASLAARGMRLEVDVDVDEPSAAGRLQGDRQRLAQGLNHLVDDLARHSDPGATALLVARMDGGTAEIVLQTVGEDAETPPVLEDAPAGAFGLGVALCEQIAELHQGHLRVQRAPGARRARYTLTLPAHAVHPDGAASRREPA